MGQITEINDEEFKKLNLPIINSKNSKVVIVDAEEDSEMKFDDDEEFFDDVNDPIPTIPNATSCKIEEISQEDDEKDQRLYAQTVAENFARLFYSLLQNPTPEAQQKLSSLFSENSTFIFQNDIVVGVAPILWKLNLLTPSNNILLEPSQLTASPTPNRGVEVHVKGIAHVKTFQRDFFNNVTQSMQQLPWIQTFLLVPISVTEYTFIIQKVEFHLL